jgi:hypothetical protein
LSEDETLTGVVEALVEVAGTVLVPVPRSVAPMPSSSATVPTDPTTADNMETARTPASHRPRNGREEVAVPLGVAIGSPTSVAVDGPPWEDGRTGVIGTTHGSLVASGVGAGVGSGVPSKLSMTVSSVPKPETVLRRTPPRNL